MHPYSSTSITATGVIGKHGDSYSDLTDHDLNQHVYVGRPMVNSLQPWLATSAPNEHQQSNYNQMYSNNNSFISPSPSSSPSVSTGCMSSVTSSPYPPPLIGGSSSSLPSISSTRPQTQQRNNSMVPETYMMPNNSHGDYQGQHSNPMTSGYHSHHQDYSPSPSPPHYRNNSIASDSSNQEYDEREHNSRSGGGKAPAKKREKALERNRQAALRCRQRKKEWLNQLQSNVEVLTKENRVLEQQSLSLREEILNLKTILLAHRDCSHAHITAGSINFDNLLYNRSSSTTATSSSNSPTGTAKVTNSSS